MEQNNIERLQSIADGMNELNERVTYVGGAVSELYVDDSAAADSRPTNDVDCVVELMSYPEYVAFTDLLHQKQFTEDNNQGAPICRWLFNGEEVDIMPTDEKILGFTNRWYKPGVKERIEHLLPNGRTIYIMPLLYFIATKLEAINSRGGNDLRMSSDFEDVIYVMNYCSYLIQRFQAETNTELKQYLSKECNKLLKRNNIREEIECALPMGETERTDMILEILTQIANK